MGSWANSLHVKHTDAQTVADATRAILIGSGYRLATVPARVATVDEDELDDEDNAADLDDDRRTLCVYQPVRGWTGVLDSGSIDDLAHDLSVRLATDTLLVAVNDSDSWRYDLHRNGVKIDEFDSMGDEDDAVSPELEAAMERGDEAEIDRLVQQELSAQTGTARASFLPPEMETLRQRIRAGQASLTDRLRYGWLWLRLCFDARAGRVQPGFEVSRAAPLSGAELARHITHVRTFFPDASDGALRRLLPQNRFPAEDLLADFLATLGLPPLYAQLCLHYLVDFGDDELTEGGIIRAVDLRFER